MIIGTQPVPGMTLPGQTPGGPTALPTTPPPAAGLNTLANPDQGTDQDQGQLPLSPNGGASIFQRLSASNSPHLQKLTESTKNALAANPQAASQPGGWAKALVGGALDALGDASAATAAVPEGGGALTGVARTLAARGQRQRAQQQQQFANQQEVDKNKVLNAESNARMVHEQMLTYKTGLEAQQASLKSGMEQLAAWRNQPNPGIERAKGLTSDQAHEMLKNDNLDPTEETLVPSGMMDTGQKDPNGNPIMRLTYSVVRTVPVDLDPKKPEDKAVLDRLNKYAPPEPGKTWQGENNGVVHLGGAQYNSLFQSANDRQVADLAAQKAAVAAGFAAEDIKKDKEALQFRQDSNIVRALSAATSVNGAPDVISARNALFQQSQDPKSPLYGKYNNIDNDMREYMGYTEGAKGEKNYIYDKMLDDYQKKQDTALESLTSMISSADKVQGPEAASMASAFESKANNPATPPALRPIFAQKAVDLRKQSQASLDYDAAKKLRETKAEQDAQEGDMSGVKDMVLHFEYDPDKLFSRFKDTKVKRDFLDDIHKTDPTWSEAQYRARYTTAQDYRPEGKGGQAVQSLNTFAGHTGDANSLIQNMRNTQSPLLNAPINKWSETVMGQPRVMQYRVAIAAAADNYLNFLLNNKAKHASDDELAAKLQSTDTSPEQAQVMLRQMANTIAIKAREQNFSYRKQMGKDIPEFLDPDTVQVFKTFGIDPSQITTTGQSGLTNNGAPGGSPQVPVGARPIMKGGQIVGYIDTAGKRTNF